MSIVNQLNRILHASMSHFWIVSTNTHLYFAIRTYFNSFPSICSLCSLGIRDLAWSWIYVAFFFLILKCHLIGRKYLLSGDDVMWLHAHIDFFRNFLVVFFTSFNRFEFSFELIENKQNVFLVDVYMWVSIKRQFKITNSSSNYSTKLRCNHNIQFLSCLI